MTPPKCERCARPLPGGLRPLRPRSGHYSEGFAGALRVVKEGVTSWWCGRRCFEKAHEKPGKKKKNQIHLPGSKTKPKDKEQAA